MPETDDRAAGQPADTDAPSSLVGRTRLRATAAQAYAERLSRRAEEERGRHGSVDAVFEVVDRDLDAGGGIIAGAIAYRLFIWLLPFSLVLVAGLGIAADASSESPRQAAGELGLGGLVSSSISEAASSRGRWYALLIGIPILVWATRSVLRVLIGAHRLVWADVRAEAPKPTLVASLRLLALLLLHFVVTGVANYARASAEGPGVIVTVAAMVGYAGIWLLVSVRLPHRGADWRALVPGAILVGLGMEVLQVVTAYFLVPYAIAKQGTYGAIGGAAVLLLGLFLISRLIVSAAILNATLWERRERAG
ncbi:MAG TPA: YhjD/YihY/BrkB family envelope integrity protein [Gaiellaceae bacterium]